jgi:mRNA (2'-O-methyladenosine-N6-)-methyltransferase
MGMLGMPGGGMGFGGLPSPFQRPPMGLGPHGLPGVKNRGGEEDDIDALLNKKSFKELQQSKTGEELLELLHRPTAKETAVAAKVGFEQSEGHHCIVLSGVHMLHDFDQRL